MRSPPRGLPAAVSLGPVDDPTLLGFIAGSFLDYPTNVNNDQQYLAFLFPRSCRKAGSSPPRSCSSSRRLDNSFGGSPSSPSALRASTGDRETVFARACCTPDKEEVKRERYVAPACRRHRRHRRRHRHEGKSDPAIPLRWPNDRRTGRPGPGERCPRADASARV